MKEYIDSMVEKARIAQREFEHWNQQQVDKVVRAIGKTVYDHAEMLAKMAVEETRMGVYAHKVLKNRGKARMIWNRLKREKSMGVVREIPEKGLIEIVRPAGVVAAITPCTNPAPTTMGNAMMALKSKNAVIFAPHPRAKKCSQKVVELVQDELKKLGVPADIVQIIEEPTVELTGMLMKACDVIVATGGMGMVRAAYSSGKPAYGGGVGNVQCIIDEGYDLTVAIPKIIEGRAFDNGIICSGEQTAIVPQHCYDEAMRLFQENGAYYFDGEEEVERFRKVIFPGGVMNKDLVGQSACAVAKAAGLQVPEDTKVIVLKAKGPGNKDVLGKEKMCPVLSAYAYEEGFEQALDFAIANLKLDGEGHSISIHSNNKENLVLAGNRAPVCRVLVNQVCATMNGGALTNGLTPTTTMGCGTWGNNSFSENFDFKFLYNTVRVASEFVQEHLPTDEEIWEEAE